MDEWEKDFEWLRVRTELKNQLGMEKLPDLNVILILIGIQELGYRPEKMEKETKQDLMHVAVCSLLAPLGYYEDEGRDEDGWPHFRKVKRVNVSGEDAQEKLLIEAIIAYFKQQEFIQ